MMTNDCVHWWCVAGIPTSLLCIWLGKKVTAANTAKINYILYNLIGDDILAFC